MNEKEQLQLQISEAIHQDLVKIVSLYSSINKINLDDIILLVQKVNLLDIHDVKYIHNNELDEIIEIMYQELKEDNSPPSLAFLTILDFIKNKVDDFRRFLYVNLCLRTDINHMTESISIFSSISQSVKKLFEDYLNYIFNETFFILEEQIQIELILKVWGFSREIFHDNEASKYAYQGLLKVFNLAIEKEQTEVAFWLYYTPLHYFHGATGSNIDELNEKFKFEVEKPLEKYILEKIVPKYNIVSNKKRIKKNQKIKVALVIQRIIKHHSVVHVFYSLVKALMKNPNEKYEFILYDLSFPESGGSDKEYVKDFISLGIRYINLHYEIFGNDIPTYSILEKSIKTRQRLIDDEIDILIGLHTRVEYMFLYATRTAPKQIYWYHNSNDQYDIRGIDAVLNHCEDRKGFKKINILMDVEKFHRYEIDREIIKKEKSKYPPGKFILGTIGRLIKIDNFEYLNVIAAIMKKNKDTIYIAAGAGNKESILLKIKELGLSDRFYFPGFVNSHLYGYIINFFPDSFPINQGESLQEFMYKNKDNAYITLKSKEFMDLYRKNNHKEVKKLELEIAQKDKKAGEYLDYVYSNYGKDFINITSDKEEYIKLCNFYISDKKLREASNYAFIKYMERIQSDTKDQFYKILDEL